MGNLASADVTGMSDYVDETIANLRSENAELVARLERENRIRKDLEKRLAINAKTGLPSHYRLLSDFEAITETLQSSVPDPRLTILIIRLGPAFSEVRKSFKATVVEWIIYQTACRLAAIKRQNDLLYHTRDNEFVYILQGIRSDDLRTFLSSVSLKLNEPYVFSGFNITIPANAGVSYYPEHGPDKSDVLKAADIALESAIEAGEPFKLFQKEMIDMALERVEMQNSILKAIEAPAIENIERQFVLHFQPKVWIKELSGGRAVVERLEAEILMRWIHPSKGVIGPAKFIPLAEETGLILPLGKWLFYATAAALGRWHGDTGEHLKVSLNISPRQMKTPEAIEILGRLSNQKEIRPELVTLELTETALFDEPARAGVLIDDFKHMGFRISLDDFGTGYSSLSLLHRYPIDEIKIDKLFIAEVNHSRHDEIIVQTIIDMAKRMGLSIVSEGVEDVETLATVFKMGCKGFQGYLMSKPLPYEEFLAFYRKVTADGGVITL